MRNPFPDFVSRLPLRDYGIPGLIVHVDTSSLGEAFFVTAEKEIVFPAHAHGAQFTMVVSGECDFTADGWTVTYRKGDSYYIPQGKKHQITLHEGYAEMNYVLNVSAGNGVPGENQQTETGTRKIDEDLKKGFEFESKGVAYLAYARKADEEGMDHIARLFRAVAESKKVHAFNHYAFMNKMGDTKANLKHAAELEKRGSTRLYPDMVKDAEAAGETTIAQCFKAMDMVEEGLANIFERSLSDPFSIKEDTQYHVCCVCGFLSEGPCDKCPACGSPADKFMKVD